jgi:hypothetical protein
MNDSALVPLLAGAVAALALGAPSARAQSSHSTLVPHAAWDCGMPEGIPRPEAGRAVFDIEIPLERAVAIGRTPYGTRRVAVGLEGSVDGPRLSGVVAAGGLDLELTLANQTIEIEQALVLRASDGSLRAQRGHGTPRR